MNPYIELSDSEKARRYDELFRREPVDSFFKDWEEARRPLELVIEKLRAALDASKSALDAAGRAAQEKPQFAPAPQPKRTQATLPE